MVVMARLLQFGAAITILFFVSLNNHSLLVNASTKVQFNENDLYHVIDGRLPGFAADSLAMPTHKRSKRLSKFGNPPQMNTFNSNQQYYNITKYVNQAEAEAIWQSIKDSEEIPVLSHSHRRAMTVKLSFDFPFYGQPVRNITVASGGFLYTGEYVHSWLAATQYIAPLMANFDTSIVPNSVVRMNDNGTAFTVVWENVTLVDQPTEGQFTFSATLHASGEIVFCYYKIPLDINTIDDAAHPVKVGLSDAYILERKLPDGIRQRRTIFEYHRVNLLSYGIADATIIKMTPLSTCLEFTDCAACMQQQTAFKCAWCPAANRCSAGSDRRRQEWIDLNCEQQAFTLVGECPATDAKSYVSTPSPKEMIDVNQDDQANAIDGTLPEMTTASTHERRKRENADLKAQYESVPAAAVAGATGTAAAGAAQPDGAAVAAPSVVPYLISSSERPLVGVNGTGQRKDISNLYPKATTVVPAAGSAVPAAGNDETTKKPQNQLPKKVPSTLMAGPGGVSAAADAGGPGTLTPAETAIIDNFDVTDDEAMNTLKQNNISVNTTTDYHNYYNSTMYVNQAEANAIWLTIKNSTHNSMLSQSHRRAMTLELSFDFPFYGHPVRNITVATGGFLYTGEYVHSWLAATQYIAPLMANFDTSISANSFVRLNDNGTAFTVVWENVTLQDKPTQGEFTFSATLHASGDIVFGYYKVPLNINAIQNENHPVKVGLSDAYIIEKTVYFARRKTIYEYHRVNFANVEIGNATIIKLTALSTCLEYTDCAGCMQHQTTFDCVWCPALNRCSTGTDRRKQEWLNQGCDQLQISQLAACPAIGQKGNSAANATTTSATNNNSGSPTASTNTNGYHVPPSTADHKDDDVYHRSSEMAPSVINHSPLNAKTSASKSTMAGADSGNLDGQHEEPKGMGMALGFMLPICLIMTVVGWMLYAYRNPHTKSGQLFIQYRPSQWSWRRGEARYTAATIHM